jgi:hypothetical protein
MVAYKAPICRAPSSSASTPDRRVVPIAIIDCDELNNAPTGGKDPTLHPLGWMDVFLVEPSLDRHQDEKKSSSALYTSAGDFYGEIIGRTTQGSGGATSQIVRRDKPYLVK